MASPTLFAADFRRWLVAGALLAVACEAPMLAPSTAAKMAYSSGNNQVGALGKALGSPLAVLVTDASGNPVSGFQVIWSATAGGGRIGATSVTDANGIATAIATLGKTQTDSFTASAPDVAGSPVTFTAGAGTQAVRAASITATPSTVQADGISAATLAVTVTDATGSPVPGIAFVLEASGGTSVPNPLSGVTDASGVFQSRLKSTLAGQVAVTATGGSMSARSTVTFSNPDCDGESFANASGSPMNMQHTPLAFTTGDFNSDGKLDLAIANGQGNVTVMLGNGLGQFTIVGGPMDVGGNPASVAAGDFNGDGILDLVTANQEDDDVTVLLGDGTGLFTIASGGSVPGQSPVSVTTGDFNGDGKLDVATADEGDGTVSVLLGDGTGGFTSAGGSPLQVGRDPQAIAAGDFDGDGQLDLVVTNFKDNTVSVLLGDGAGAFTNASASPIRVGQNPTSVAIGDVNGDGKLDLSVANEEGDSVSVLLGNGEGGFMSANASPFHVGDDPDSVVIADFNGDGHLDLAAANSDDNSVTLLLGDGRGGFSGGGMTNVANNPRSLAIGDFNGDGVLDLATLNGTSSVSVLLSQCH